MPPLSIVKKSCFQNDFQGKAPGLVFFLFLGSLWQCDCSRRKHSNTEFHRQIEQGAVSENPTGKTTLPITTLST